MATTVHPTLAEAVEETEPLIGFIPGFGPPAVLILGPWVFLALLLAPPFAVLVTLVLLVVTAAAVVALIGTIVAAPFLLVRRVRGDLARGRRARGRRPRRAAARVSAPRLVAGEAR